MKKEIEEMNKAVRCLALELPEQVFLDFFGRWTTFRDSIEGGYPSGWEKTLAQHLAGASSGMQWVRASDRTPPLRVGQTFSEYVPLKMYDNRFLLGRVHESAGKKSFEITSSDGAKTYFSEGSFYQIYWLDESSPSSMQEENERLRSLLNEYGDWEAAIISENKLWWPNTAQDVMRGHIYDKMIELQGKRNKALNKQQ